MAALGLTDALESRRRASARPGAGRLGQVGEPRRCVVVDAARGAERAPGAKADGSTGPRRRHRSRRRRRRRRQTRAGDRDPRRPRRRRAVGHRHPLLVEVQPDDRLACRPRLGHDRRRGRRPADRAREPAPADLEPATSSGCSSLAGSLRRRPAAHLRGAAHRQGLDRRADRRDRGRGRGGHRRSPSATRSALAAGAHARRIAVGRRPVVDRAGRPDVPAGDFDIAADALDGPARDRRRPRRDDADRHAAGRAPVDHRRGRVFGVGLVAAGRAARRSCRSPGSPLGARLVGVVVVVAAAASSQRRLRLTRAALPLVVIAGIAEVVGSMLVGVGLAREHRDRRGAGQRSSPRSPRSPRSSCSASGSARIQLVGVVAHRRRRHGPRGRPTRADPATLRAS